MVQGSVRPSLRRVVRLAVALRRGPPEQKGQEPQGRQGRRSRGGERCGCHRLGRRRDPRCRPLRSPSSKLTRAPAARKAERDRLLAEEEASLPAKVKAAPKAGTKKVPPKAPAIPSFESGLSSEPSSFSASGIVRMFVISCIRFA